MRKCRRKYTSKYTKEERVTRQISQMKKANLKRDFGITLEYYHELLESQNECCAICGKPEVIKTQRGNVRMLSVDHDHTTREVRGLLCMKCNSLIGHAKEEVSILERAIAYLKKYK